MLDESPAHIAEGSETRVSGRPKETPGDGFRFEFSRELPLTCYLEDCGRLLHLVKGGPDQLPPVRDLVFKDEYEHAACSSVKVSVFPFFSIIFLLLPYFSLLCPIRVTAIGTYS